VVAFFELEAEIDGVLLDVSGHGILTGDGRQGSPLVATSSHQWWPSGFTSR
jgi:hypothetical protein